MQEDAAVRIQAVIRGRAARKQAQATSLTEQELLRICPLVRSCHIKAI